MVGSSRAQSELERVGYNLVLARGFVFEKEIPATSGA